MIEFKTADIKKQSNRARDSMIVKARSVLTTK